MGYLLLLFLLAVSSVFEGLGDSAPLWADLQIYGGSEVTASNSGPLSTFMVFVINGNADFSEFGLCGGSLIGPRWVLLAAHCCAGKEAVVLVAGRSDLAEYMELRAAVGYHVTVNEDNLGLQERRAARIFIHEQFNDTRHDHDIAVILLDRPFQINDNVSTVTLSSDPFTASDTCTLLGWGTSSGLHQFQLMYAEDVPALPIDQCIHRHEGSFICLAKTYPPKGICRGESGTPLLCGGRVRGVASYAYNYRACGFDDEEYYLDTHPYLSWVEDVLNSVDTQDIVEGRGSCSAGYVWTPLLGGLAVLFAVVR